MEYVWNNSLDPPGQCASTAVGEFLVARNGVKWISGHQKFNLTYFWSPYFLHTRVPPEMLPDNSPAPPESTCFLGMCTYVDEFLVARNFVSGISGGQKFD